MRKETYKSVGKKVLASALSAAMVVAFAPAVALADVTGGNGDAPVVQYANDTVAVIGDTEYKSLIEALNAAKDGDTITLTKDSEGVGLKLIASDKKSVTIDFAGHAYVVTSLVGSTGSENQAAHFEKGNTVCLINGTIAVDQSVSKSARFIVQNYAALTAENMVFDGTNLLIESENLEPYTLSNNGNTSVFKSCTIKVANRTDRDVYAIDSSVWGSYQDTDVTLDNCTVEGKLDIAGYVQETDGWHRVDGIVKNDKNQPCIKVVGGTYSDIANAVKYAVDKTELTMGADATGCLDVPVDKDIALDLNGKTLSVTDDCGIDVKGKLAVSDSTGNGIIVCDDAPVCSEGSGIFTLNSGTIKSARDYGVYCKDGGTAIVNGGVVTSKNAALSGNNTTGDMNFEINGGTLTAAQGPAIYMPGQVKLTITDGVLNGGISLRMGQVDISGGVINAIQSNIDMPTDTVDGNGTPGYAYGGNVWFPDALYVIGGTYTSDTGSYGNSLNLNITGGTFNCTNDKGSAVAIYDLGKVAQDAKVNISGNSKFITNSTNRSAYQVLTLSDIGVDNPKAGYNNSNYVGKVKSSISAGAFSSDPDNSYKAAGTETHLSPNDGMYHVHAQNADVRSDSAKAPTCTEPGYTAGSYCGIDGYQYSNGSTIPALGHEAGEYVVTTPATETTEGIAISTCTRCGEVLGTKTIEKLKPAGTEESGTSDTGEKVDVTVSDNTPGKTESGTEYVGSVEFNGSDSGSTGQPSSEANIPETVEVNGSTYVVTKIADEAFKDQEQLKSISIPATVIEVGKSAFEGTGVQSIVIPAATSSIGASAFKGCTDLKTIDIQSAALKEIPASAFEGCASLQTANVPATIEKVGAKAFAGTAISDVILPEATTEVGASAFKDCESLKTVEFKGGVTAISNSLFQGAKALETIELPTSVTTIGKSAFEGTALKSLALPAAVKTVGSKAFASTPITSIVPAAKTTMTVAASGDGTLVLPAGLTTLGTSAFAGCASLKTATLPAKIKALAASTFSGCTALKSVDISGVAAIGKSTFAGDKALKSLKTGTKLTTIGSSALSGAKALKTLSVSTKKLTKKGVKSSLKGSSVKTVKVKASKSKKTNKKYIAKYKKYFAKKNSGKKVTVK